MLDGAAKKYARAEEIASSCLSPIPILSRTSAVHMLNKTSKYVLLQVTADGLTLHVGISCGVLCFGILGGIEDYWECLMSGDPISLVARALDEAEKQQVDGWRTDLMSSTQFFQDKRVTPERRVLRTVTSSRSRRRGRIVSNIYVGVWQKGLNLSKLKCRSTFAEVGVTGSFVLDGKRKEIGKIIIAEVGASLPKLPSYLSSPYNKKLTLACMRRQAREPGIDFRFVTSPFSASHVQVVVSAECLRVAGDCCRGTRLPSNNLLLSSVEPPRKEKRGSVRVANMIANKGLPVELEPVKGLELFGGMAGGTGGMSEGVTTLSSPAGDRISPIAAAAAAATLYRGDNDGGTASQMADTSEVVAGVLFRCFFMRNGTGYSRVVTRAREKLLMLILS